MKTTHLACLSGFLFNLVPACGVQHKASGKVTTENEVRAKIEVDFPLCHNPEWNYEQVMHCVTLCSQFEVKVSGDTKVLEYIEKINEETSAPENVLGVY